MAVAWRMEREAERRFMVGIVKEVVDRLGTIKIVRRRRRRSKREEVRPMTTSAT